MSISNLILYIDATEVVSCFVSLENNMFKISVLESGIQVPSFITSIG